MRTPRQHAPLVTAQPASAVPAGCRAPTANDLLPSSAGVQPAALVSLVRTLARQAAAGVLRAHGADVAAQVTPIPHPSTETE